MVYQTHYASPLGTLTLTADDMGLTCLSRSGGCDPNAVVRDDLPVFQETRRWLELYFSGREPDFLPPLHLVGTDFQMAVWEILLTIPYGKTTTYGEIAAEIAARQGKTKMSAQAVGGAVGRNPICILVPCHRVVGKSGNLTGYAGGLDMKVALLKAEHMDMRPFFLPKQAGATEASPSQSL